VEAHVEDRLIAVGQSRNADGLTQAEATARLAVNGPNVVPRPRPNSALPRMLRQLTDPLVVLLLAALTVTLAVGDLTDSVIIALVVLANATIGVVQDTRADRAIAALDSMAAPTARVLRDGADRIVPASELVVGDLVRIDAGDVVPADLRLTVANQLRLDESALTGESVAVSRDRGAEVQAGTVVVTGRAAGPVIRTGTASALGRKPQPLPGLGPGRRRCNAGSPRSVGYWVSLRSCCPAWYSR
jgi:P-type Ca2+ transporter type 2C